MGPKEDTSWKRRMFYDTFKRYPSWKIERPEEKTIDEDDSSEEKED